MRWCNDTLSRRELLRCNDRHKQRSSKSSYKSNINTYRNGKGKGRTREEHVNSHPARVLPAMTNHRQPALIKRAKMQAPALRAKQAVPLVYPPQAQLWSEEI